MHFADRLCLRIDSVSSRLVIGIDPDPKRLFGEGSAFGKAFPGLGIEPALGRFCNMVLEVAAKTACAVKPQMAFFESYGIPGLLALKRCLAEARRMGLPVILDGKRGDIGNTAAAYARAYLEPESDFFSDALTVNPYLGLDSLEPFVSAAKKHGSGLFVLVKTSNPGSGDFQDVLLDGGIALYSKVAKAVRHLGKDNIGSWGYSNVGAVCGATYPEELARLRELLPRSILLLPGFGAQGGTAGDIVSAFYSGGKGAIVSASRSIIFAYETLGTSTPKPDEMGNSILRAAEQARNEIEAAAGVTPTT